MNSNRFAVIASGEPLDCFGSYNKGNPLCTQHCVIRLRCAIEQNDTVRAQLLEDLIASEETLDTIQ